MKNNYKVVGDVIDIELKNGGRCLIDLEELPKASNAIGDNYWYKNGSGYIVGGNPAILLHRLIMDTPSGLVVDHINHLKWDNRKVNLKNCTSSENGKNKLSQKKLIEIGAKEPPKKIESNFLTTKEVMELLNVKRQTLHVYREKKGLPYIKINNRTIRYERDKVLDWLKEQCKERAANE